MKRANTILAAAFLLVLSAMAGYTLSEFPTMRTETLEHGTPGRISRRIPCPPSWNSWPTAPNPPSTPP